MSKIRLGLVCALGMVLAGLMSPLASAQVLQSTNFEPPTYAPGDVGGQDGWTSSGNATSDPGTAIIQTAIAKGTQALKIDTAPLFDAQNFFFKPNLNFDATGKKVNVTFDINIQPRANAANPPDRSTFVVGLFDPNGAAITYAGIADDGSIYYTNAAGGNTFTLANPITQTSGWNTIGYTADFSTGKVSLTLNGTALPIADAVIDPTAGTTIADLDIVAFPSGYDQAVFDNIVVQAPEPGTFALLGVGALGLMRRRNRVSRGA